MNLSPASSFNLTTVAAAFGTADLSTLEFAPWVKAMIDSIIKTEAGYVNDPADSGGETCWGITIAVARAHGYIGRMQDLPKEFAFYIYLSSYYLKPGFYRVAKFSDAMAHELTDTGVNMGQSIAVGFLASVLGEPSPGSKVDNALAAAVSSAVGFYGDGTITALLNCLQGARYVSLSNKNTKNRRFTFGWLANRVDLDFGGKVANVDVDQAFANVVPRSRSVAIELSDIATYQSIKEAGRYLQTALNSLNYKPGNVSMPLFADLGTDGVLGSKSYAALDLYIKQRGKDGIKQLVKALNCMQGEYIVSNEKALANRLDKAAKLIVMPTAIV